MKDLNTGKTFSRVPFSLVLGAEDSGPRRLYGDLRSVLELPLGTLRKRTLARTRPREV